MTTDTIGDNSNSGAFGTNIYAAQVTASASGNLSSIGINVELVSGNCCLAIYTDSGGVAGTLLGQSAPFAVVLGWNDVAVTGVSIVSGMKYWIAFMADNTTMKTYLSSSSALSMCAVVAGYTFPTYPASPSWITGLAYNTSPNLRITYAPAATSTLNNWF